MEESLLKTISDIGISGAVTFYLLFKFSKSIDGLTQTIGELIKQDALQREELKHFITEEFIRFGAKRSKKRERNRRKRA